MRTRRDPTTHDPRPPQRSQPPPSQRGSPPPQAKKPGKQCNYLRTLLTHCITSCLPGYSEYLLINQECQANQPTNCQNQTLVRNSLIAANCMLGCVWFIERVKSSSLTCNELGRRAESGKQQGHVPNSHSATPLPTTRQATSLKRQP
jgi:hypothetical protein